MSEFKWDDLVNGQSLVDANDINNIAHETLRQREEIRELLLLNSQQQQEIEQLSKKTSFGLVWYIDTDKVVNSEGENLGALSDCMTNDYAGSWFYAVTSTSTAGEATYPEKYTIDGANGHLSLRDYVIWTGDRLVHIPTFEAKGSTIKNSDGKYSPKSGVDGLMSSTDKAYLGDLINSFWGKDIVPNESITEKKIADNAITEKKIANGAVSEEKLSEKVQEKLEKSEEIPSVVSNALKGQKHTTTVVLDDISNLEHDISCKVWSRNLLKYPYREKTKTVSGVTFTDNGDGSITVDGTATANVSFGISGAQKNTAMKLPPNTTVTMKAITPENYGLTMGLQKVLANGLKMLKNTSDADVSIALDDCEDYYVYLYAKSGVTLDNITVYPQIEVGTTSSDWVSYVDSNTVRITEYGKNLCPQSALTVAGNTGYKNLSVVGILLAPATYTASVDYKQTGTQTTIGINIRKVIRDESNKITSYENVTTATTSTSANGKIEVTGAVTSYGEYSIQLFSNLTSNVIESECEFTNIQMEVGSNATSFENYREAKSFVPNENGETVGVKSVHPVTTLVPNNSNVTVAVGYNRDINKAFAKLEQAIISLGGNV